ncbi:hypothetical protein [uncultured Acidaminococcus sp.]|uniref:hypothetical protein n=1 Tax=uncultured Acidaminococcus sp. TaxID=352152 RepID=UPI0025FD1E6E|nr:hypothetical protein [uncultured Acidaminococcus sp.]
MQPFTSPAFEVMGTGLSFQLTLVHRCIVAQAVGMGGTCRSGVLGENALPQAVQVSISVHIANVLDGMTA